MLDQKPASALTNSRGDGPISAFRKKGNNPDEPAKECPRLFWGVSPADYAKICCAGHVKLFGREEMLHVEGDAVKRVLLLISGCVKITKLSRGGEEVILRLKAPGDVLGMADLSSGGKHSTTAQASRACQALAWDARVFKDLADRHPILHQNMVAILDERLRELENRFREVATGRVGTRVAFQLLRLLKSMGRPVATGVEIHLSREDLAQMTGTTLFTVSRLLSTWEERGIVRPRREAVEICDVSSLHAASEGD